MRIFTEEQRFVQTWLIVLLAVSVVVPIAIILKEFTKEDSTMSINEVVLTVFFILLCTAPIFLFKLKTRIDEKGIHYCFFPIHRSFKTIEWPEIELAFVRKYNPISEYGGWGLKGGFSRKNGKAINVSGDIGIQLKLKNSKKLLIGTQKEYEAKRVLETYKDKIQYHEEIG